MDRAAFSPGTASNYAGAAAAVASGDAEFAHALSEGRAGGSVFTIQATGTVPSGCFVTFTDAGKLATAVVTAGS